MENTLRDTVGSSGCFRGHGGCRQNLRSSSTSAHLLLPPAPSRAVHPQPIPSLSWSFELCCLLPGRGVGTGRGHDTRLMSCGHGAKCQGSFWDQFGSKPVARCSGARDARQMRSRRRDERREWGAGPWDGRMISTRLPSLACPCDSARSLLV